VADADVMADERLERVEVVVLGLEQLRDGAEPERRRRAAFDQLGALEEEALEALDAEPPALLELLPCLDLVGDDLDAVLAQRARLSPCWSGLSAWTSSLAMSASSSSRAYSGRESKLSSASTKPASLTSASTASRSSSTSWSSTSSSTTRSGGSGSGRNVIRNSRSTLRNARLSPTRRWRPTSASAATSTVAVAPVAVDRAAVLADGAVEELEGLDVEVGVEDRLAREHHAGG
jgi:hypothetical protein